MTDLIARLRETLENEMRQVDGLYPPDIPGLLLTAIMERDGVRALLQHLDSEPTRIRAAVEGEREAAEARANAVIKPFLTSPEMYALHGPAGMARFVTAAIRARTP